MRPHLRNAAVLPWLLILALAPSSVGAVKFAAAVSREPIVQVVRNIHGKLAKVLSAGGLGQTLLHEAEHADAKAQAALALAAGDPKVGAALEEASAAYRGFVAHLVQHEASLRGGAGGARGSTGARDRAAKLLPRLRGTAEKLVRDLAAASGGEDAKERALVVAELRAALSADSAGAVQQVLKLHQALEAAEALLTQRTKLLSSQEATLKEGIEEQQLALLYKMLRQRKMLPMPTQVAMLRRSSFANCSWAEKLERNHSAGTPLVDQLEAMLPAVVAEKLRPGRHRDRLAPAAAGDGSVHVVSSRMKNAVLGMARVLGAARDRLEAMEAAPPKDMTPQQLAEGKTILVSLNGVLLELHKTKDLRKQLELMDKVERQLQGWMAPRPRQ